MRRQSRKDLDVREKAASVQQKIKVIDSGCVLCLGVVLEGDGNCVGCYGGDLRRRREE